MTVDTASCEDLCALCQELDFTLRVEGLGILLKVSVALVLLECSIALCGLSDWSIIDGEIQAGMV